MDTKRLTIPVSPGAPYQARSAVAETLGPRHPRLEAVLLATSEIVSNAVQHGNLSPDDSICLEIDRPYDRVRVTVTHPGVAVTSTRRTAPGPGGWGLRIVDSLAGDWGIGHGREGVSAWFEIQAAA